MPTTFSINIGQLTESTRKADIFSVLNDIQDNTQKLISPRDIRDAFLSTWANSPFKITTPNTLGLTFEYIGIDSSNPFNRDIKQKILLGKRSYGGLDIMNSTLLNSSNDADIFIFNTKADTDNQDSTKISILAGTNSGLYYLAPYIESKVGITGSKINLNLINPSINGAINILSNTGRVSINTILFPTVSETAASASNGKILRYYGNYPNGYLKWVEPTITYTDIGNISVPTNIYGSDVFVNGYSLEFIDDNQVPNTIGGIQQGMSFSEDTFWNGATFQNWPVSEVLKDLLFPYTPPKLSLSLINPMYNTIYGEVGVTTSVVLSYSITTYQRNISEKIVDWQIVPNTPLISQTFNDSPGTILSGTISSTTFSSIPSSISWNLNVSDSIPNFFSYSVNTNLKFVYPIFYGYSQNIINDSNTLVSITNNLNKYIYPYPGLSQSIELPYTGSGYFYIIYSNSFGNLMNIKDPNEFIIFDKIVHDNLPINQIGFTTSVYSFTQSYNNSAFRVWRSRYISSYTQSFNNKFKFIF